MNRLGCERVTRKDRTETRRERMNITDRKQRKMHFSLSPGDKRRISKAPQSRQVLCFAQITSTHSSSALVTVLRTIWSIPLPYVPSREFSPIVGREAAPIKARYPAISPGPFSQGIPCEPPPKRTAALRVKSGSWRHSTVGLWAGLCSVTKWWRDAAITDTCQRIHSTSVTHLNAQSIQGFPLMPTPQRHEMLFGPNPGSTRLLGKHERRRKALFLTLTFCV